MCALFLVMLYFSKYSNIKLGKDDEPPEYNGVSWFMMLFACGIGVGLFFYGVAEPIFHYTGRNRYTADPTIPDNTLAQISINLTFYHWGNYSIYAGSVKLEVRGSSFRTLVWCSDTVSSSRITSACYWILNFVY